jgi:monoamine oxidase
MSDSRLGGFTRRTALKLLGAGAAGSLFRGSLRGARLAPGEGTREADVIVVGAGFAGLTAARILAGGGRKVAILDARDRVGGRVKPGRIAGQTVDLGGQWVGPKQTHLLALLREYGIATTPQYVQGRCIVELNGRRVTGPGESYSLGSANDAAVSRLLARVGELVSQVPLEEPWTAPRAREWDRITVDEWIRSQTRNRDARAMMRLMVEGLYAAEPEEVSLLFFLSYIRSGGSLEEHWASENGAQAFHVPGSMHQLAGRMGAEVRGNLTLDAPVTAIAQDASGVTVRSMAGEWRADRVIVAVPVPLSARIVYDPALPPQRDALAQRSPMGSVIKYWIAYKEPFWRRHGLNGDVTSDRPPTDGFYDGSPPDASVGLLVGFISARSAIELTGRPIAERRKLVLGRIAELLGPEGADAIDYVENDWPAEPWTRGCYGANMGPGVLTTLGPALREPFGRIHWAGTETSPVWSGYIEGAIRSGERAAGEVRALLR